MYRILNVCFGFAIADILPVAVVRSQWPGLLDLRSLVVFGDSYSSEDSELETSVWVTHFVNSLLERAKIKNQVNSSHTKRKLKTRNYAKPGDTAREDLPVQLSRFFSDHSKAETGKSSQLPKESLYVLWFGINDCGAEDDDEREETVDLVFDAMHDLYVKADARNFLLIDIPPVHRSPLAETYSEFQSSIWEDRIEDWNERLREQAVEFATSGSQATVFLYSSNHILTKILDKPLEYGLSPSPEPGLSYSREGSSPSGSSSPRTPVEEGDDDDDDGYRGGLQGSKFLGEWNTSEEDGSPIWADELHMTSAVHGLLAQDLIEALLSCS
ncbi:unnamed protein product [Somion occarium]|uniref:Carbohydrate esterase family 16 protein n=1 Tax=Somion occarium TaxID=3059160 RepID=A0ABP1DVL3_9APHY